MVPAGAPAGMMKSGLVTPSSQSTLMTTRPCDPAAGPAIVFFTTSEPGARNSAVPRTVVVKVPVLARIRCWASLTPPVLPS